MLRLLASAATLIIVVVGFLIILSPVDPLPWVSPPNLLAADACETAPSRVASVFASNLPGQPDGMAFGQDGALRVALSNGSIVAIRPSGDWRVEADGGGTLTGLAVAKDGTYAVDEARGGLFKAVDGKMLPVLTRFDGQRLRWTNDVTALADGRLLVTTTSARHDLTDFFGEVLEHRGSGLLLSYDPNGDSAALLRRDFEMTNGLAVDEATSEAVVAESAMYGLRRVDLNSGKETRLVGLPGFTGNIRASDRPHVFWVTLLSPRNVLIDRLAPYPWARKLLAWLPAGLRPGPRPFPCLIELTLRPGSMSARAVRVLVNGDQTSYSTAIERNGVLYLSPAGIVETATPVIYAAPVP